MSDEPSNNTPKDSSATAMQTTTPSLPPEVVGDKSTDEMSYTRRLLAHALQQTREHNKMELKAGLVAAIICAALVGAWGSLGLSALAFVLTLIALFFLHLFHSASGLDEVQRERLTERTKERDSLKLRLEELTEQKLKFEVDWRQGRVFTIHDDSIFDPPEIEPFRRNLYYINSSFKIHFVNEDINPRIVRRISVSLFRITRNGKGKEKEIQTRLAYTHTYSEEGTGEISFERGLTITEPISSSYRLHGDLELNPRYGLRLNEHCFLRFTIHAMNQRPYSADIYPDWETALSSDSGAILMSRSAVQYRVHRLTE